MNRRKKAAPEVAIPEAAKVIFDTAIIACEKGNVKYKYERNL